MNAASMEIRDGCLHVGRELRSEFDIAFEALCAELLDCPERELLVDLGDAVYIGSAYIGILASACFCALAKSKILKIVGTQTVLHQFAEVGLARFVELEEKFHASESA